MDDKTSYEMLWDCPSCGTKKLLGVTHRRCPNCGTNQDPKKRYFPEEGEEIATDNHEYVGADKICPACRTANSAKTNFCINCGTPMEGQKEVSLKEDPEAEKERKLKEQQPENNSGNKKNIILIIILLLVSAVIAAIFIKKEKEVIVTGHTRNPTSFTLKLKMAKRNITALLRISNPGNPIIRTRKLKLR